MLARLKINIRVTGIRPFLIGSAMQRNIQHENNSMRTYLVGGAVRDRLLGLAVTERDWVVVGATPQQLLDQGYQPVGKDFPVFLHPQSKEEYALARTERKSGPGYTGFDCYAHPDVTLEQDLLRRDLTVNAIAEQHNGDLIDPFDGQKDLQNRVLRHVSPAFTEDPLRVLRLARFIARFAHLGFSIAPETLVLAQQISASGELQTLPAERLWRELEKSLQTPSPQHFFTAMNATGAATALLPELTPLDNTSAEHLQMAANAGASVAVCFALLFARRSPEPTEALCQRLKCPSQVRELALLVSRHASDHQTWCQPEAILTLFEQLDAFRRGPRFEQFLQCCALLFPAADNLQTLPTTLQACKKVDTAALIAQGFGGQAMAAAVRQQRLQLVTAALNSSDNRGINGGVNSNE